MVGRPVNPTWFRNGRPCFLEMIIEHFWFIDLSISVGEVLVFHGLLGSVSLDDDMSVKDWQPFTLVRLRPSMGVGLWSWCWFFNQELGGPTHSGSIETFNGVLGSDPDVGFSTKNWAGLHTLEWWWWWWWWYMSVGHLSFSSRPKVSLIEQTGSDPDVGFSIKNRASYI